MARERARPVVEEMKVPLAEAITRSHVQEAKERLILARATHLDSLLARLRERPVRRVLGPVLAGTLRKNPTFDADFEYVVDLGLVAPKPPPRIANPIYQEVIFARPRLARRGDDRGGSEELCPPFRPISPAPPAPRLRRVLEGEQRGLEERTRFEEAVTPFGRAVTVLRA